MARLLAVAVFMLLSGAPRADVPERAQSSTLLQQTAEIQAHVGGEELTSQTVTQEVQPQRMLHTQKVEAKLVGSQKMRDTAEMLEAEYKQAAAEKAEKEQAAPKTSPDEKAFFGDEAAKNEAAKNEAKEDKAAKEAEKKFTELAAAEMDIAKGDTELLAQAQKAEQEAQIITSTGLRQDELKAEQEAAQQKATKTNSHSKAWWGRFFKEEMKIEQKEDEAKKEAQRKSNFRSRDETEAQPKSSCKQYFRSR